MNKHINKVLKELFGSDAGQQAFRKYYQMTEHPGWKTHQDILITLKGLIVEEILSKKFTDLSSSEKDVQQRAYAGINEIIDFLINPVSKAQKLNAIKLHNTKMEATVRKRPPAETTVRK